MNEFQSLTASAFRESIRVTGETEFRLRGSLRSGSLTDLTEEEKFDLGQIVTKAQATLEFPAERFSPALRNGELVSFTRDGANKVLRIGKITADEVSINLILADPNE